MSDLQVLSICQENLARWLESGVECTWDEQDVDSICGNKRAFLNFCNLCRRRMALITSRSKLETIHELFSFIEVNYPEHTYTAQAFQGAVVFKLQGYEIALKKLMPLKTKADQLIFTLGCNSLRDMNFVKNIDVPKNIRRINERLRQSFPARGGISSEIEDVVLFSADTLYFQTFAPIAVSSIAQSGYKGIIHLDLIGDLCSETVAQINCLKTNYPDLTINYTLHNCCIDISNSSALDRAAYYTCGRFLILALLFDFYPNQKYFWVFDIDVSFIKNVQKIRHYIKAYSIGLNLKDIGVSFPWTKINAGAILATHASRDFFEFVAAYILEVMIEEKGRGIMSLDQVALLVSFLHVLEGNSCLVGNFRGQNFPKFMKRPNNRNFDKQTFFKQEVERLGIHSLYEHITPYFGGLEGAFVSEKRSESNCLKANNKNM